MPQSLAVASLAGSLNVLATNPIWLTVTRMQTAASQQGRSSFFREIQSLYDEGGLPALWRVRPQPGCCWPCPSRPLCSLDGSLTLSMWLQGTLPSLIMVVNPTIQYALYELVAKLWKQRSGVQGAAGAAARGLSSFEIFSVASLAKLGATLLTYPLLVVKNRTQVPLLPRPRHQPRAHVAALGSRNAAPSYVRDGLQHLGCLVRACTHTRVLCWGSGPEYQAHGLRASRCGVGSAIKAGVCGAGGAAGGHEADAGRLRGDCPAGVAAAGVPGLLLRHARQDRAERAGGSADVCAEGAAAPNDTQGGEAAGLRLLLQVRSPRRRGLGRGRRYGCRVQPRCRRPRLLVAAVQAVRVSAGLMQVAAPAAKAMAPYAWRSTVAVSAAGGRGQRLCLRRWACWTGCRLNCADGWLRWCTGGRVFWFCG